MSNIERDLKFIWEIIYQFYKVRSPYEVSSIVDKYSMDHDDVYQVACMSYVHAEKNYKPELGVKFHTFAAYCIKSQLIKIVRDFKLQKRDTSKLKFVSLDDDFNLEIPVEGEFEEVETKMFINKLLDLLTVEERYLVLANYDNPKTQTKIGQSIGVKQITVSRRVKKAVAKMREVAVG